MDVKDLDRYRDWFSNFTRSFHSSDAEEQKNISLKIHHTYNVCGIAVMIAEAQSMNKDQILLAEAAALFHDIGRFPQYAQFRTFRDSISVNHGKLGAELLVQKRLFESLPENEAEIIVDAVKFHNAFAVPDLPDEKHILFLKLVRDADKLDIWRIFLGFFEGHKDYRASEAGLGLPDLPFYSEDIIENINNMKTISHASLRTLNDFKLLQLSWIYDLNFRISVRLMMEEDYLNRIASLLPQNEEIKTLTRNLTEYADKALKGITPKVVSG